MTDIYDGPTPHLITTCATCKFWHQLLDQKGAVCRRHAPMALAVLAPEPFPKELRLHLVWPATAARDWCGDHQARGSAT